MNLDKLKDAAAVQPAGVDLRPGQIGIANQGSFDPSDLNYALTNFSVGLPVDDFTAQVRRMAPRCPTTEHFNYRKFITGKENLVDDKNGHKRAEGAQFGMRKLKGTSAEGSTYDKGLTIPMDAKKLTESKRRWLIKYLISTLGMLDLIEILDLLDANSVETSVDWTGVDAVDPDISLQEGFALAGKELGVDPNYLVLAKNAFLKRKKVYRSMDGMASIGDLSVDEIRDTLMLDYLEPISGYSRSVAGGAFSDILSTTGYAYYMSPLHSEFDPSSIMHFYTPIPAEEVGMVGGTMTESDYVVFERKVGMLVYLTVYHRNNFAVGSAKGIRKFTIT